MRSACTSHESLAAKLGLLSSVVCLILGSSAVSGATVSLAWNPSSATNVAGYNLFYGVASRQYRFSLDAGTNTTITVRGLADGQTYYFATAAYNSLGDESEYSNEVSNSIPRWPVVPTAPPAPPTAPTPPTFPTNPAVPTNPTNPTPPPAPVLPPAGIFPSTPMTSTPRTSPAAWFSATLARGVDAAIDDDHKPNLRASVNSLAALAGVYNGLFDRTSAGGANSSLETTAGFLGNCVIKANGRYTARLACAGRHYSTSGTFNAKGDATEVVSRRNAGLPSLHIVLHVESAFGTGRITGLVSNMDAADPWVAALTACLSTNAFPPTTNILVLQPLAMDPSGRAPDHGTGVLTVATDGMVSLVGRFGDGTLFAQTVPIAGDASFPVYVSLSRQSGLLTGWMNLAGGIPAGNLNWIRAPRPEAAPAARKEVAHVLQIVPVPAR
jgi:hypothetical protein